MTDYKETSILSNTFTEKQSKQSYEEKVENLRYRSAEVY